MDKEKSNYYQEPTRESKNERSFQGVWIPKEIYLDDRLGALDKILLAEIASLDTGDGCYASNEYLAEFCQCGLRQITTIISKLKSLGLVEQVRTDGRRRWLKCTLAKIARQTSKNCEAESQKVRGSENVTTKDIFNNIYNNINNIPLRDKDNTDVVSSSLPPKGAVADHEDDWEQFWKSYTPVKIDGRVVQKGSKSVARKKYMQIRKKGVTHDELMQGMLAYIRYCKENAILSCGVAVFLNQERWKDDYGGPVVLAESPKLNDAQQELMRQGADFLRKYGDGNDSGYFF